MALLLFGEYLSVLPTYSTCLPSFLFYPLCPRPSLLPIVLTIHLDTKAGGHTRRAVEQHEKDYEEGYSGC